MKKSLIPVVFLTLIISCKSEQRIITDTLFCTHKVVLDEQKKIVPWYSPADNAYDHFLRMRWEFIKNAVPNSPGPAPRSRYPIYYFYSAFITRNDSIFPDSWMNDIGEKIPNWFENARLYYAYSGDESVMKIVKDFMDYTLQHGSGSPDFAWPSLPYTTTNPGDTIFRGFSAHPHLVLHEIQVDHASDMGLSYYRMYLYSGDKKYLDAALNVADALARYAKKGDRNNSVWPYRVVVDSGRVTAPYGANWAGACMLLESLIRENLGNVEAYKSALDKARDFILAYPMKTGYWTDGHTDTDVKSNTYKSNMSASNMTLCLFDYPEMDPDWERDIPMLINWTEKNFIFRSAPGEPSTMWGANIVGEQDTFLVKMDYQTARYAAECARWYAISGDNAYKEKAYRALNWVTYCNDSRGMAFESPVSKGILSWWSDCYGECPRMFYHAFAAIPEWAPPRQNHILYSKDVLKDVQYGEKQIKYAATTGNGVEYLRLSFRPSAVTIGGKTITESKTLNQDGCIIRKLGKGDYAVTISHSEAGEVMVNG